MNIVFVTIASSGDELEMSMQVIVNMREAFMVEGFDVSWSWFACCGSLKIPILQSTHGFHLEMKLLFQISLLRSLVSRYVDLSDIISIGLQKKKSSIIWILAHLSCLYLPSQDECYNTCDTYSNNIILTLSRLTYWNTGYFLAHSSAHTSLSTKWYNTQTTPHCIFSSRHL